MKSQLVGVIGEIFEFGGRVKQLETQIKACAYFLTSVNLPAQTEEALIEENKTYRKKFNYLKDLAMREYREIPVVRDAISTLRNELRLYEGVMRSYIRERKPKVRNSS